MDDPDKTNHIAILTDMATRYTTAKTNLEDARDGLTEAVADAKAIGMTTAEIMQHIPWSRAQVKNIARYSPATPVASDQPAETPA